MFCSIENVLEGGEGEGGILITENVTIVVFLSGVLIDIFFLQNYRFLIIKLKMPLKSLKMLIPRF